jgi:hypothetical protein
MMIYVPKAVPVSMKDKSERGNAGGAYVTEDIVLVTTII